MRDADYHFAPGRDDRDEADAGGPSQVMVTADDTPEPDPETLSDEERLAKNISRVSGDVANFLLRDEPEYKPDEERDADYDEMD